jgi:SpoVK/Ycf46/Vps4 family AAA+-type ATPase
VSLDERLPIIPLLHTNHRPFTPEELTVVQQMTAAWPGDEAPPLLFDEADALFGKRSEVKDSHDRHANIEVSYLLQRVEAYRGLAILISNLKQALDPAFMRRLRFVVDFPFPAAAERAAIWTRSIPA